MDAAVSMQDGIERKFLGGPSSGMLGDEFEVTDPLARQEPTNLNDHLGQMRLEFRDEFGVGGFLVGRHLPRYRGNQLPRKGLATRLECRCDERQYAVRFKG